MNSSYFSLPQLRTVAVHAVDWTSRWQPRQGTGNNQWPKQYRTSFLTKIYILFLHILRFIALIHCMTPNIYKSLQIYALSSHLCLSLASTLRSFSAATCLGKTPELSPNLRDYGYETKNKQNVSSLDPPACLDNLRSCIIFLLLLKILWEKNMLCEAMASWIRCKKKAIYKSSQLQSCLRFLPHWWRTSRKWLAQLPQSACAGNCFPMSKYAEHTSNIIWKLKLWYHI